MKRLLGLLYNTCVWSNSTLNQGQNRSGSDLERTTQLTKAFAPQTLTIFSSLMVAGRCCKIARVSAEGKDPPGQEWMRNLRYTKPLAVSLVGHISRSHILGSKLGKNQPVVDREGLLTSLGSG